MARREIPTDVIGTSHLVREYTNLNFEECYPIATAVTKTVGAGKDFELFHDAMMWVQSVPILGGGWVQLVLDNGIHVCEYDPLTFNPLMYSLYSVSGYVDIRAANESKANCKITLAPDVPADLWPFVFSAVSGGNLQFLDVTLDAALGGCAVGMTEITMLDIDSQSRAYLYRSDVLAAAPLSVRGNAELTSSCVITAGASGTAVSCWSGGIVRLGNNNIVAGLVGLKAETSGRIVSGSGISFGVGVITPRNIPVNQIQYDGSYISNSAAALSFKP